MSVCLITVNVWIYGFWNKFENKIALVMIVILDKWILVVFEVAHLPWQQNYKINNYNYDRSY